MSCGTKRPFDQRVAGTNTVAAVNPQVLAVRHEVFALDAALVADDDRPLAAAFFLEELDAAVDLGDDRRLLGPPGLEQLGDPGQAAGDILGSAHLARGLGQKGAGRDHLAVVDLDTGPLGDVLVVERLALGVDDDDLRVQVALVLDDRPADVARRDRSRSSSFRFRRYRRSGPCRRPRPGSGCCAGPTRRACCRGRSSGRLRPS